MTEARIILSLFAVTVILMCGVILQQNATIKQQQELIREMKTNPKCMVAPTPYKPGGTPG